MLSVCLYFLYWKLLTPRQIPWCVQTHLAIKLFLILILILNVTAGAIPGMWASSLRIWAQRALFKEMSGPLCYLNPLLIHWSLFSYSVEIFISVPGGERAEIPLQRLYNCTKIRADPWKSGRITSSYSNTNPLLLHDCLERELSELVGGGKSQPDLLKAQSALLNKVLHCGTMMQLPALCIYQLQNNAY